MEYKNIIFDVGEVLFSYDWKGAMLTAGFPLNVVDELVPELLGCDLWKELDLGIRPYFDIVNDMCMEYPMYAESLRKFLTDVEDIPIRRPRVWKEVHRLKEKGYHLYVLSNYPEYMFKIHVMNEDVLKDMDGLVVSYMVNAIKPDKKIFDELVNQFGIDFKESLFFDDRVENTDAAKTFGIDAYTVRSEEHLLSMLSEL